MEWRTLNLDIQVPKKLMENNYYSELSMTTKLLYSILLTKVFEKSL